jgi:hypothetical protein
MASWFRRGPAFADDAFAGLSLMLTGDAENKTHRCELLPAESLDYSLESLKHVDAYLGALHRTPPPEPEVLQVVLRTGAYLGEVIRRQRPGLFHWVLYEEAARHSPLLRDVPESIATAGILWKDAESMAFPLGKVCKYLENGPEDSVYTFGYVFVRDGLERAAGGRR